MKGASSADVLVPSGGVAVRVGQKRRVREGTEEGVRKGGGREEVREGVREGVKEGGVREE